MRQFFFFFFFMWEANLFWCHYIYIHMITWFLFCQNLKDSTQFHHSLVKKKKKHFIQMAMVFVACKLKFFVLLIWLLLLIIIIIKRVYFLFELFQILVWNPLSELWWDKVIQHSIPIKSLNLPFEPNFYWYFLYIYNIFTTFELDMTNSIL